MDRHRLPQHQRFDTKHGTSIVVADAVAVVNGPCERALYR